MLAILSPGQGAQKPGFLTEWLENEAFANRLSWLASVAGLDLISYGTTADAETIRDTSIAQPLLVSSALAVYEVLDPEYRFIDGAVLAGHSVGEIPAAALAGVFSPEAAMVFVRERGDRMAAAAAETPTGMSAILAGKQDEVLDSIDHHGLTAANYNGKGQIVAAGALDKLAALADEPPARTRVVPLSVAGAFHTEYMASAVDHLRSLAAGIPTSVPSTTLLSNRDGSIVADGTDYLDRLVNQVAHPVRWDLCMDAMAAAGVTGIIELTPGGTLTGMAKRNMPGVELFALNSPSEIDDARDFCAHHSKGTTV